MKQYSESPITIAIDLNAEEAAELATSLARATPSMLIPLTGLSGAPAVQASTRLAATLGRLVDALARAGYPADRSA